MNDGFHAQVGSYSSAPDDISPRVRKWLALAVMSPAIVVLLVCSPALVRWAGAHAGVSCVVGGIVIAVVSMVVGFRVRLLASIRRRVLYSSPTEYCRRCGYNSEGLERERVEHTTLPLEHARCPECGRMNPR